MSIVRDEDILGGEPRIDGTRIGVRHVAIRIVDHDLTPAYVADQLDLSMAEVHRALAYYYDHIDEIREIEAANQAAFDRLSSVTLKPPESSE